MVAKPSGFLFLSSGGLTAFQTAFTFSKAVEGPLSRRPIDADPKEAAAKITALLNTGIRHVINLMEPDETDITGQPFVPYEELLESLAAEMKVPVTFDRLPIRDMSVPPERFMWRILNQIDMFIGQGRPVFVLGMGGTGRTGTVVGCYLRRHGLADGKNVLEMIRVLRKNCENAERRSPETSEQRQMVMGWGKGAWPPDTLDTIRRITKSQNW